ncbi:ABC transporter-related protein [Desulfamplus magnetovallimortis]|uniref:ABC transporter-related protein n=1 Tax=Desulfamplus magnetovallimortis TaxID=1246637 RepID=A0A1W1HAW5_9BACT|nr:ABC transporter ATP-binding protein [Desulfamplus magnetovallimortis]SLM29562.1 ABC transporter-related protein [Desulfamplus magnetovallimortis]
MIEIRNLTKKYGKITAVNDLTLTIPQGEIFGFIGPNGAGKTTTISMMAGLLSPTSGSITVCGTDMLKYPEKAKQKIGYIPDRPYIYEKLTAMEFLKFTADLFNVPQNDFITKAEAELKRFSLLDWADELIESFSHGMKQRLIMCAALFHDPELVVVDEPMVGLDPSAIRMVKILLKELAAGGTTVFMSTHTLQIAQDVCNRIGVIHKGKLIAEGTVEELTQKARADRADLEQIFMILTEVPQS